MKKIVFIVVIMFAFGCQKSTKNNDTKLINCPQDFETFFHQFPNLFSLCIEEYAYHKFESN